MSGKVDLEIKDDIAFLVIDNPPVNASSAAVRRALLARIEQVEADPSITGAILIGAGKTFVAGSDLREFDLPLDPPQLPQVIAAIETSAKPYVAALHGAALGGGYELSLACDGRIAAPDTVVGLPECTLGTIPGAGGTQKLPRMVGKANAISLICSGRRVTAEEGLRLGMIEAVADADLRASAVTYLRSLHGKKSRVIEQALPKQDEGEINAAIAEVTAHGRGRPHILAAIEQVLAVGTKDPRAGLDSEREVFQRLRVAPEARALRHIFFAERQLPEDNCRQV